MNVCDALPAEIVTVRVVSSPAATKSPLPVSAIVTRTFVFCVGTGVALSVKEAAAPSSTPDPAETAISGIMSSSSIAISPSPARLPVAPPPRPVAASFGALPVEEAGMDTVTVSSSSSASSSALSMSVASVALGVFVGPSNVTVLVAEANVTPVGLPESASVNSAPAEPPENCKGAASASPALRARPRFSLIVAVAEASPSFAVLSGVESVTVVASLSFTDPSADAGLPNA